MFVDSHIHLTHKSFEGGVVPCITSEQENIDRIKYYDRNQLINELRSNDIALCIEPGIDFESNYKILDLARLYPDYIYPVIGVHPTRTFLTKFRNRKLVEQLIIDNKERIVGIGELGLDYHYDRKNQHRFKQKIWFIWQLKLAAKYNLPVVLHIRDGYNYDSDEKAINNGVDNDANKDAIRILSRYKNVIKGGVCHCFKKGPEIAKIYTEELGFLLGIGGSLLCDDCSELEKTVIHTPLEYIILETDGPYVKPARPEEISGKKWNKARNTSLIIPDIARRIAALKGSDIATVENITSANAMRLFNINMD